MINAYEKMFKLSIRNMEWREIEICQITLKFIFRCNPRSMSGSEVCPLAAQHVLDVPLPFFHTNPKKNVTIEAYSEPLIREIAGKQIRWVIGKS